MDDTHQPADGYAGAPDTKDRHPAEALAELDPADVPEPAEALADRLAEELEGSPDGYSGSTDPSSGADLHSEME